MDRDKAEPLRDEARKRKEWRGDTADAARTEGNGHTLPASEDDDEAIDLNRSGKGFGIIPPPD